jgi:hypothetical protein
MKNNKANEILSRGAASLKELIHLESPCVGAKFSTPLLTALVPAQNPIKWVPGLYSGGKSPRAWRSPPIHI